MKLNNPLILLSFKLLGVGVDIRYATHPGGRRIEADIEILFWAWEWEKTWQSQ